MPWPKAGVVALLEMPELEAPPEGLALEELEAEGPPPAGLALEALEAEGLAEAALAEAELPAEKLPVGVLATPELVTPGLCVAKLVGTGLVAVVEATDDDAPGVTVIVAVSVTVWVSCAPRVTRAMLYRVEAGHRSDDDDELPPLPGLGPPDAPGAENETPTVEVTVEVTVVVGNTETPRAVYTTSTTRVMMAGLHGSLSIKS